MKDLLIDVLDDFPGEMRVLRGACRRCGGDLTWHGETLVKVDRPLRCPSCGAEHRVDLSADGARAKVRLPRNADVWLDVTSSNLAAVGVRGRDLLVRFASGAEYRYPGAAGLLPRLVEAESKGKFFAARVRGLPCERLP